MQCSKLKAALVTLALVVASSTPAMALENEFSGSFTIFYDLSNYTAAGNYGWPGQSNFTGLAKDAKFENFVPLRVRLGYTAKANADVKLVTKFELDYSYLGNSSYVNARNGGGALGSDTVNIETKNLYLDMNLPNRMNTKLGMINNSDAFKGLIFNYNDMAGIQLSQEYDNAKLTAGLYRFSDRGQSTLGRYTNDMVTLEGTYKVSKEIKIGAAYYYIGDNRENGSTTTTTGGGPIVGYTADGSKIYTTSPSSTTTANPKSDVKVHTVGLNFETIVGPLTLNGFGLAQFGDLYDSFNFSKAQKAKGYAFNVGAKMPLAGGTVRSEFLYAAGGKNSLYVTASDNGGSEGGGFYDNEMIFLSRDKNNYGIDSAIVYDANNFNQGVIVGSVGYDYPFTPKLSGSVNAGFAKVAQDSGAHKSDYLGTEINFETNYKLQPNVTIGARAGYVFLGDYFKTSPKLDNPYDVKLIASYSF
jgi:hypothetical protein